MQSPVEVEHRGHGLAAGFPLSTLLSQVLVAFTVELDNEFERQMPHRTTISRAAADGQRGPWLVSLVMWSNLMQFVGEEGATVGALQRLARTAKLSLVGMERWGYIVVGPDPADGRPRPPRRDWMVRATRKGRRAQEVWRPLPGVIEKRWEVRFGNTEMNQLREALWALVRRLDIELPEYLPVLGYGLFAEAVPRAKQKPQVNEDRLGPRPPLSALLSQVLFAFALEFERESDLSLAINANVVRLLNADNGARVRDLPRLAGVSKEAIQMAIGFLEKRGYIAVEPDPADARTKLVRLTRKGGEAQTNYSQRLGMLEELWQQRFGEDRMRQLRESLERLTGKPDALVSPLCGGLEPYPGGWRASVRRPETLPHYPMVLHRGGYPDGS